MESNNMLRKIKDSVEEAIRPLIKKGDAMTPADLESLTKAVCIIEKIKRIEEGDYNEAYSGNNSYDDNGNSYRRGRSPYTGRFVSRDAYHSRDNYHDDGVSNTYHAGNSHRYYDGGSANNGYSGHSILDRMIDRLERMYDEAQTDHERQTVNDWIRRLRNN